MGLLDKTIDRFNLSGTKDGRIEVAIVKEPYGEESESVVSIGIFLNSDADTPNWKAHIPKSNIDQVIKALEASKKEL